MIYTKNNDGLMAFSIAMKCMKEKIERKRILNFLRELRESDELMIHIFSEGSCFRLYKILKTIYAEAKAMYSRIDGHWITEINGSYYDINGKISKKYIEEKNYETTDQTTETSASIPTYSNKKGTSYNKYEER